MPSQTHNIILYKQFIFVKDHKTKIYFVLKVPHRFVDFFFRFKKEKQSHKYQQYLRIKMQIQIIS